MTICTKTLDTVRKRLEGRKSLEEIGMKYCFEVDLSMIHEFVETIGK